MANEANRFVAADSTNEALKTSAAATKLVVTEATVVLNDSTATLESVNAQINAVRSNVEALALELRKFLGSDVIEVALNTSVTSGLKVGEGEGILVEKGTTATPSMDDPNGAGIKAHTLRTGVTATTEAGWYTFDSYDLNSYNVNMAGSIFNGTALNAYIRFSLDSNPNTQTVLAELVSKTDGQVLEKHTVETDTSVVFTYPKTINANNENIKLSYETQNAVDGSTYGNLRFIGDTTGSIYNNTILPVYQINTTTYKVEDGRILATYNLQTIGGQTVTSSGQREFAGYEFVEKIVEPAQGGYPVGTVYVAGKVNTATDKSNTIQYKVIRTIVSNTEYVHEIYVLDPTYTGTVDWDGLDTRGFFKLLETSHLSYTPDRVSYDYNTNATISANYTVDPDSGYMVFAESPLNAQGSKYRVVAQWSGTDATGPYGRIFIGSQVWTKANTGADTPFAWQSVNGSYIDLGYAPYGIQQTLRGASTPAALTTTYVYRALNQEAIIRYQVEGATDYLEDSGILMGGSGTDINYSTEETINKYKKLGYELVSDNFTTSGGQDYDSDTAVLQEFLVVIKPRVVDVPKIAVPGEPVDPTDPNSPVWPATVENLETTQEVTRTVEYKYEDGTPVRVDAAGNILPKDSTEGTPLVKTETVTFTRPAQVNLVTGEVTYGEWAADTTDVLNGNLIPEVTDYTATRTTLEGADAPMTESVTDKTVVATDADINEVVYYTPNPKFGDVVVNYVNENGKVIATPVVDTNDALVGTDYSTADQVPAKIVEDATGDVYYYKEIKAEDAAKETGKVVEGTTEVTYVYEKAGNVVVNYITEDGTVIKTPVNDETNAKPGSPYDTTDNKPKTITTEDGTTYELVRTDGNENGSVEGGKTTEVTYVYRKVEAPVAKTGNVVVEYYNTDGEKIAADVEDTPEAAVGTVYETLDYKPTTITKDGVKYYYKEVKATSATEKGTVTEGTTTVQYVYEPGGSVTVNYVTTDGTVIKSPVKDEENAEPGKSYTTEDNKPTTITTEDGKTYKLVPNATTGDENGTITSGEDKQVTYVYEEVKGNVVVNYIDTEGNVIKTPVEDTKSVSTGTAYDTTDNKPTTITTEDGTEYKLVPVLTKGEETGKVVEGTTQVTYVYQKVTTPAPKPNGSVVVNYVNTNGETIATSVNDTTDAKLDTPYDTTDYKPAIIKHDGVTYYYKEVKSGDSETGNVVEGTTEVTYIYEPGGSVTVNYVTTDGAVIKSPVKDEENAEPGKSYTTEDNKPTTITTEDGKTYKLVPNATTGDENGTITSGEDKQVTYVYEEVKGNVVVNYIDTEGNVIKTPVEDTKSASTGTAYDTTDNKPTTITTEDGTVYEIVPVLTIGSESGSVVEGTTQVTYVYRKVSTPTPAVKNGTVVVNYVTEDGTVIKSPVTDTPTSPEGTSYDTTDNKPTEIVTEDGSRYVLIPSKTIGSENGTVVEGETVVTYVYKKVANWIPQIPSTPENPTPVNPVVPYPFDPTNPDKPVDPTTPGTNGEVPNIPYVPGYTPVDPKGNTPLKPVDPNDPGKGYVPPTPDETEKDTPIPYVQNGNVVVNYVTEDGTVIKAPVQDETNVPAGKSYDTTDNKPKTITTEDGTTYELVRVDGSENGKVEGGKTTEVTYVYRKVTPTKKVVTNHVDEDGNPIAPQEEGTTPNKSIPGYEFTGKTITDEDGNTTHIYKKTPTKKVVTNHVDEEGNPIAPQEEGTTPDKSIPGYEFTGKTITDEDGNTTHIYKKTPTKKVVTNHVDEEGNVISPQEDGTTPNKGTSIPGYEYVRTVVDVEGNTTHIYRKVSNKPTPPATETPVKPQPATPTPTADKAKQLPNTGEASSSAGVLGAAMLVSAIALAGKRRRNED
ncbi:LPXTG cell wall anchor domain-containing protein [Streptococcus suis]|nr:LPXTG cell wall anchor domain-containing protein [Streptococcus suis]